MDRNLGKLSPSNLEEDQHRTRLLNIIGIILGGLGFFMLVVQIVFWIHPDHLAPPIMDILLDLSLVAVGTSTIWFVRRADIQTAKELILSSFLIFIGVQFYFEGNPNKNLVGVISLLLYIVVSMILLDRLGRWIALFAGIFIYVAMFSLWSSGSLPIPPIRDSSSEYLFNIFAIMIVIGVIALLINSTMDVLHTQKDFLYKNLIELDKVSQELRKKSNSIVQLYDAGKKLGQTLELESIYETVYQIISDYMVCDQFIISSFDPKERLIECKYLLDEGKPFDVSEFPAIPVNEEGGGTQSRVILSGESLLISDYEAYRKTSRKMLYYNDQGIKQNDEVPPDEQIPRSALIVPIKLQDQVVGVIQIFSYQIDDYSEDDLQFLEAISPQVAAATSNAILYEKMENTGTALQETVEGTIQMVADIVEARDPYTAGHQKRVAALAVEIARKMELPEEQIKGIYMAGTIHDLGKIKIPSEILSKPGKLSAIEFDLIKIHPSVGYDLLKNIIFPWPIAQIVLQHHERLDGQGYPSGLMGYETLLEARILAVADVVDAVSSHRPYRPALGIEKALEIIGELSGSQFDPDVVNVCLQIFDEGYELIKS